MICTECIARQLDSTFEEILPYFKEEKNRFFNWGLVNGRTQTHVPWGWGQGKEPEIWFHDVIRADGTYYDKENELARPGGSFIINFSQTIETT